MHQFLEPSAWREVKQRPKQETKEELSRAGGKSLQSYLVLDSQRRQGLHTGRLSTSHLWTVSNPCCMDPDIYIAFGCPAELQPWKGKPTPSCPVLQLSKNILGLVLKSWSKLQPSWWPSWGSDYILQQHGGQTVGATVPRIQRSSVPREL